MFPNLKINPDALQRNKLRIHRTVGSIELTESQELQLDGRIENKWGKSTKLTPKGEDRERRRAESTWAAVDQRIMLRKAQSYRNW